jgi:hypothetical protein
MTLDISIQKNQKNLLFKMFKKCLEDHLLAFFERKLLKLMNKFGLTLI